MITALEGALFTSFPTGNPLSPNYAAPATAH